MQFKNTIPADFIQNPKTKHELVYEYLRLLNLYKSIKNILLKLNVA